MIIFTFVHDYLSNPFASTRPKRRKANNIAEKRQNLNQQALNVARSHKRRRDKENFAPPDKIS
jgi:hypothetical protein